MSCTNPPLQSPWHNASWKHWQPVVMSWSVIVQEGMDGRRFCTPCGTNGMSYTRILWIWLVTRCGENEMIRCVVRRQRRLQHRDSAETLGGGRDELDPERESQAIAAFRNYQAQSWNVVNQWSSEWHFASLEKHIKSCCFCKQMIEPDGHYNRESQCCLSISCHDEPCR